MTIVNVAELTVAAAPAAIRSNEAQVVVAERLDVGVAAGTVATTADGTLVASFTVVNRGNGREAFAIAATAAAGSDRVLRVAVDGDGNGRYDPARDPVPADAATPPLPLGETVTVFAVVAPGTVGDVTLAARAVTGAGTPGDGFPGAGDGGGDAVVGPTGAQAAATVTLAAEPGVAPSLSKRATVTAPDGSARAMRGATIEYVLVAGFPAAVEAAVVADPVPAGTAYVPGSLSLDGAPLSDAADADPGRADGARIAVALGDQPAGAVRTVRFRTVIQ